MNLQPGPFKAIESGLKDIEMRLYDDRRKKIKVGDIIMFTNTETDEKMFVEILNLYRFKDFKELYNNFDKNRLGYKEDEIANPSDMEKYYTKELINQFGVLGIEIQVI